MLWRFCACIVVVITGAAVIGPGDVRPLVIHNASPSVPVGFYIRSRSPPAPGAFVTVRAADVAPHYARDRNFSDSSDRFIKRVAAIGGETVCAHEGVVTIGRMDVARATTDSAGRSLPRWSGCRVLAPDELFLLGDTPDSFDSRYWGPVPMALIDGVWTPLTASD